MLVDILGQALQTLLVTKYDLHGTHRFLALLYISFARSLGAALLIVGIYLLHLLTLKGYLGNARDILDVSRNSVCHRLLHRIARYNISENLYSVIDRRTREAHKRGIREGRAKQLGIRLGDKSSQLTAFVARHIVFNFQLCVKAHLCAMGFVREADDVATLVEQANLFAELLYRADKEAS